ncbi:MAG: hypothetical protein HQL97_01320 [Magnetococcales bacterium]|nr:hypothetical protein [Magnetococcales bacterium]
MTEFNKTPVLPNLMNFTQRRARDSSEPTRYIYSGYAVPGTFESQVGWMVTQEEYDGDDFVACRIAFDGVVNRHNFIWDNRESLTYV